MMTPLQHKRTLDQILKFLTPDGRRKTNRLAFYFDGVANAKRLIRKTSRQFRNEERESKRIHWKKKGENWVYQNYSISRLTPLPFEKDKRIKYWLGKKSANAYSTIGLGTFADIETAKYIVYLLTKK